MIATTLVACRQKEILFHPGDESSFIHQTGVNFGNRPLEVFYHVPQGNAKDMEVLFVMHGASRNGDDYFRWTIEVADKYGFVLLAPSFPAELYPTREYQEGNIVDQDNVFHSPEKMTYQLIDDIFEYVFNHTDLKIKRYNIIGHSAGGQFVHRLMQFSESQYIDKAVACNPGWYTFPDETIDFPYGIAGYTDDPKSYRKRYYGRDLTILLGTADTIRDRSFRVTPEADLQGLSRFERGQTFFNENRKVAMEEGVLFNWKMKFIDGIDHNGSIMCPEAVEFMCNNQNKK